MIERSLSVISNQNIRGSLALRNDLRNSFRLERILEKNSLSIKSKLVEERGRTLKALALRSKEQEKDKKGGVGGALGLLGGGALAKRFFGGGGGGGLLRGFKPKVPNTPSELLRMQRGTSSLSRVRGIGGLGRIGPLAVIGTGLDFAGRRAEGQTNLQAGVGAGGGLAGALAGGKAGALLGTALGGPIGTVVGGIGGSIVGGLAGGNLADLFTGADRRRRFEEQRVLISTQKSLFSSALDDLDSVLNKLEDISLLSLQKKEEDDPSSPKKRFPFGSFLPPKPKPKTPFLQRPVVQIIGYGALLAGTVALGGITGEEFIPFLGLLKAMGKTKLGAFIIKKSPFLARFARKVAPVVDDVVEGPLSNKGLQVRADKILRDLGLTIEKGIKKFKVTKGRTKIRGRRTLKGQDKVTYSDKMDQDTIRKISQDATKSQIEIYKKFFKKPGTRLLKEKLNPKKKTYKKQLNLFRVPKNTSDSGGGASISMNELEPPNNDFIALAPDGVENNIFLMNSISNNNSQPIVNEGGKSTVVLGDSKINTVDLMYLNAAAQQSMTA